MKKTTIALAVLAAAAVGNIGAVNAGTIGITGDYTGTYSLTVWNGGTGAVLGASTTNPNNLWSWDFTAGTASFDPGALNIGFPYSTGPIALVDNGNGTYTGTYGISIGTNSGTASTTWDITQSGNSLMITTWDTDSNGIPGTTLAGVMPLPISLQWDGSAVSAVPVPAAVWLFGSGLLGLVGVARKRKVAA
ncbi:MAG: VPLPA-CTERM sorting domain-containing protein [Thiohalobacteraceae bacterium]|nr:VPLPA-CTERM sorting domain-containing protein [Gammaproteobacteria bacterium]